LPLISVASIAFSIIEFYSIFHSLLYNDTQANEKKFVLNYFFDRRIIMDFEEKFVQEQAKVTENLDKAAAAAEQDKADTMDKVNAFVSDPDAIDKVFDKVNNAISTKIVEGMDAANNAIHSLDGKIDDAIKASTDMYEKNATAVQNAVDKGLESAEGNYYAAQEMASMAADRGESIVNSALIQAQMRADDVKEKIDGMKKDAD
jgi:hypothetical protein